MRLEHKLKHTKETERLRRALSNSLTKQMAFLSLCIKRLHECLLKRNLKVSMLVDWALNMCS